MYTFGGRDENNERLNDTWMLNLQTNKWSQIEAKEAPNPRSGHSSVFYKDMMVVFGGIHEVT